MATKIVRYEPPPEIRSDAFEKEPFFAFLRALQEKNRATAKTSGGGALWSAMPVERMVADGVIPVLLNVAKILDVSARTEIQIQTLAELIQPFLNVGLQLLYPTAENAASAFEQNVHASISQKPRGKTTPANALWSEASARFFAAAVKRAVAYGKDLTTLTREINEFNTVEIDRQCWSIIENLDGEQTWASDFSLHGDPTRWPETEKICSMLDHLTLRMGLKHGLKNLLGSEATVIAEKDEITTKNLIVENQWFHTQIIRVALRLPFGGSVTALQYTQGIRTLRTLKTDEVLKRFFATAGPQASRLDDIQRKAVSKHLYDTVDPSFKNDPHCMRAWKDGVDHLANDRVCIIWKPEEFAVTSALEVAAGIVPNPFANTTANKRARLVKDKITSRINWKDLAMEEIDQILETGVIPATDVFRYLLKTGKRGTATLKKYAGHPNAEPVRTFLLKQKCLHPDYLFFERYGDSLTTKEWRRLLPTFLRVILEASRGDENPSGIVSMLATAANHLHQDGKSLADNKNRVMLVEALYRENIIDTFVQARGNRNPENTYRVFVGAIGGEDIWHMLILACELLHRIGIYKNWKKFRKGDDVPCAWEKLAIKGSDWQELPENLGIRPKDLPALLAKITERDVFNWMFEGRKDRKRLWSAYLASKKRFENL